MNATVEALKAHEAKTAELRNKVVEDIRAQIKEALVTAAEANIAISLEVAGRSFERLVIAPGAHVSIGQAGKSK